MHALANWLIPMAQKPDNWMAHESQAPCEQAQVMVEHAGRFGVAALAGCLPDRKTFAATGARTCARRRFGGAVIGLGQNRRPACRNPFAESYGTARIRN